MYISIKEDLWYQFLLNKPKILSSTLFFIFRMFLMVLLGWLWLKGRETRRKILSWLIQLNSTKSRNGEGFFEVPNYLLHENNLGQRQKDPVTMHLELCLYILFTFFSISIYLIFINISRLVIFLRFAQFFSRLEVTVISAGNLPSRLF